MCSHKFPFNVYHEEHILLREQIYRCSYNFRRFLILEVSLVENGALVQPHFNIGPGSKSRLGPMAGNNPGLSWFAMDPGSFRVNGPGS